MNRTTLKSLRNAVLALAAATGLALSETASAGLVATISSNDCSGVFGGSFEDCKIPSQYDPNQSPIIAKYEMGKGWEINTALFPGVTADDFTLTFNDSEGKTGTWSYTPDGDDPLITFFVAKAGPSFNLFGNGVGAPPNQTGPYALTNTWFTPGGKGLSHLTFYDGGSNGGGGGGLPGGVPEPATLLLFGAGLVGLGATRRKRTV